MQAFVKEVDHVPRMLEGCKMSEKTKNGFFLDYLEQIGVPQDNVHSASNYVSKILVLIRLGL
jgi:hypothetical protein